MEDGKEYTQKLSKNEVSKILNLQHPSIDKLPSGVSTEVTQLSTLSEETTNLLNSGFPNDFSFPLRYRLGKDSLSKSVLPYQAVIFHQELNKSKKENTPSNKTIVLMPGFTGTAAENAHVAAELLKQDQARNGSTTTTVAIDSSGSRQTQIKVKDLLTQPSSFPKLEDRCLQQAELISTLLSKHPTDKLFIVAHSFAGIELPLTSIYLHHLLAAKQMEDTHIGGLIMLQATGQYEQKLLHFLKQLRLGIKLEDEIEEMFGNDQSKNSNEKRKEIFKALQGADQRTDEPLTQYLPGVLNFRAAISTIPRWIRHRINWPVALVFADRDVFFPKAQAATQIESWKMKEHAYLREIFGKGESTPQEIEEEIKSLSNLYPKAPICIMETSSESKGAHTLIATEPQKVIPSLLNIIDRLENQPQS